MAESLQAAGLVDGTENMRLDDDDDVPTEVVRLNDPNYYENPFSWKVRESCDSGRADEPIEFKTLDQLRKNEEKNIESRSFMDGKEVFSVYNFATRVVICYELYITGQIRESLNKTDNLVESLNLKVFIEFDEQCINAYKHILYSMHAFIVKSMKLNNFEEIMKNIKPISEMNDQEKSAIHAVKALVFFKYPSKSKRISFQEANNAFLLHPTNTEYLNIWLIAKGRINREYNNYAKPDEDELEKAKNLYDTSKNFYHLYHVSDIFIKVSKYYRHNKLDKNKMIKYFKLSSEAIRKAIDLAGNNNVEIEKCLKLAIDQPKLLLPEYIIFDKIKELQIAKNNIVNCLLGIYHFKHTKDYEEAKNYFNKGIKVDVHDFLCFYYIIKIECWSKDPCDFPFIKMLMDHYPNFLKDIERVKILSQILIYCVYYQKDQAKLLYFLQKFMDQPFDNAFKYRHLNSIWPLWKLQNYNGLQFIEDLSNIVKQLMFTNNSNEYHKTSENFFKMIYEGKNIKYTDDIRIEMPKYESSNNSM